MIMWTNVQEPDLIVYFKNFIEIRHIGYFGFGFAELAFGSVRIGDFGLIINPQSQIRNPQYI
jgi:hypothetical protein